MSRAADPLVDFEAYVRASQRKHKRLAYLLTGDLHAAEDLLQAAYAKLYPEVGHRSAPTTLRTPTCAR